MKSYPCRIRRVVDGDTVDVVTHMIVKEKLDFDITIKLDTKLNMRIRLGGIDAPEVRGTDSPLGKVCRTALKQILPVGTWCTLVVSKESGKFGRVIGDILLPNGTSATETLLRLNLVAKRDY